MIYVLAGRNAVMMVISIIALVRQDARFYSFAFLMHSLRDFQDMFITPLAGAPFAIFLSFSLSLSSLKSSLISNSTNWRMS